jgi:tetratricopeptide (TPR) repeat protein
VEHHPAQLSAQFQLGFLLYQQGREEEAVERLSLVAEQSAVLGETRFRSEVLYFLGRAHYEADRDDDALEVLGQVSNEAERFSDARILMARIYEARDDFDSALVETRRAAAALPENTQIQVYLAGLMERNGELDDAVALMESLIEKSPDETDLVYDLGLIYGSAEQEDRALELMLQVLDRDPDHPSALNYIGYTWAERGTRLDEAFVMVSRAVDLKPDDGFITDSLGWVHYQQGLQQLERGEATQARASFQRAVELLEQALALLEEDDPIIARHLGDAYRSVSRFDDALQSYRHALSLGPEEEDIVDIERQIELLELQQSGAPGARR